MPLCMWENEFKAGLNLCCLMCYHKFCLETLYVKPKAEFTSEEEKTTLFSKNTPHSLSPLGLGP